MDAYRHRILAWARRIDDTVAWAYLGDDYNWNSGPAKRFTMHYPDTMRLENGVIIPCTPEAHAVWEAFARGDISINPESDEFSDNIYQLARHWTGMSSEQWYNLVGRKDHSEMFRPSQFCQVLRKYVYTGGIDWSDFYTEDIASAKDEFVLADCNGMGYLEQANTNYLNHHWPNALDKYREAIASFQVAIDLADQAGEIADFAVNNVKYCEMQIASIEVHKNLN